MLKDEWQYKGYFLTIAREAGVYHFSYRTGGSVGLLTEEPTRKEVEEYIDKFVLNSKDTMV